MYLFSDLSIPFYEKTTVNYILGATIFAFGLCVGLMLYVNIIASEGLLQENKNLIQGK